MTQEVGSEEHRGMSLLKGTVEAMERGERSTVHRETTSRSLGPALRAGERWRPGARPSREHSAWETQGIESGLGLKSSGEQLNQGNGMIRFPDGHCGYQVLWG